MNHLEVQLIGVGPTVDDEPFEPFCYTVDAPTNLWIHAICDDGSRMGLQFMAYVLNSLIEDDSFNEGDTLEVENQVGANLVATVGEFVFKHKVQANLADTEMVRIVRVAVVP